MQVIFKCGNRSQLGDFLLGKKIARNKTSDKTHHIFVLCWKCSWYFFSTLHNIAEDLSSSKKIHDNCFWMVLVNLVRDFSSRKIFFFFCVLTICPFFFLFFFSLAFYFYDISKFVRKIYKYNFSKKFSRDLSLTKIY